MNIKGKIDNIYIKGCLTAVICICFVAAVNEYLFAGNTLGHESIFNWFILLVSILIFHRGRKAVNINKGWCYALGFLLAFSIIVGGTIYKEDTLLPLYATGLDIISTLASFVGITGVFGGVFILIFNYLKTHESRFVSHNQWGIYKYPMAFWPVILVCWIPCYLAFFPGLFNYDSIRQSLEALGLYDISKFHPTIHTFLWRICLNIEDAAMVPGLSMIIYCTVQMLVFSGALSCIIRLLIRRKVNNYFVLVSILFFALNPVFAMFSISMTKDVIFTALFVLYTLEIFEMIALGAGYLDRKSNIVKFIIISVLCCLFRNNMIYVYILMIPVLLVLLRKSWKKLLLTEIVAVGLFFGIYDGLYGLLGVADGNVREKLSVPMMQMAKVVVEHKEDLDDETNYRLSCFFSKEDTYADDYNSQTYDDLVEYYYYYNASKYADIIKDYFFNTDYYKANSGEFWSLWFDLLKEYPMEYLEAFLDLNSPSWYIDADSSNANSNSVYIDVENQTLKFYTEDDNGEMASYEINLVERKSKSERLLKFYQKFASYELVEDIPIVNLLFSEALPIWLMLACMALCIIKKQKNKLIVFIPALLLWLTYLLGPLSCMRYVLPMYALYPLFMGMAISPDITEADENISTLQGE